MNAGTPTVRPMDLTEVKLIIDYFHDASNEHLARLGVDPKRLPDRASWETHYARDYAKPVESRKSFLVVWEAEEGPFGFSTVDKIVYGQEAYMHLHIIKPELRRSGYGAQCVRQSARLYFETFRLQRLFCEPNAFNVAPNRTLQRAGFQYVMTHETIPGPLNHRQAVTRWMLEKDAAARL